MPRLTPQGALMSPDAACAKIAKSLALPIRQVKDCYEGNYDGVSGCP